MEKTTKKKKSKRLKKRIGLIAVGGLSLVLTICLSVGATLAWFAGSTWSSQSLYMGGPVYVEMAGRGTADNGTNLGNAKWIGGSGSLDIQASTRDRGTATSNSADTTKVLLPGQKYEIYSQARVFSTAYVNSTADGANLSNNSGSNISNTNRKTGNGTYLYSDNGKVTTTTTSVLRARFSVAIEFDPYVGFNNFTDPTYAGFYPEQSKDYEGDRVTGTQQVTDNGIAVGEEGAGATVTIPKVEYVGMDGSTVTALDWEAALGADEFDSSARDTDVKTGARRDAVKNADGVFTNATAAGEDMTAIKNGTKKSIYAWKFVTESVYKASSTAAQMPAPFDGSIKTAGGVGYYGLWLLDAANEKTESDAFYAARCNSYLQSYVEEYITEYGGTTTRTIGETLRSFETDINNSFITLINDSSDAIHAGHVSGMTVDPTTGVMTYNTDGNVATNASWLYVDSTIGNDTNTQELSTSVGGWWYLVESDGASAASNAEIISTVHDAITYQTGKSETDGIEFAATSVEEPYAVPDGTGNGFTRYSAKELVSASDTDKFDANDENILYAKLYEITPDFASLAGKVSTNGATKVVSYSFPFVNGSNVLPTTLTNIFANAKITFQISFQAVQAFFPYSTTIDGLDYKSPIIGMAKALNIKNAIPIYNEAFAY